jgi:hypothetical protein
VKGVISHFACDDRVHVWDIFNEPDNPNLSSYGKLEPPDKAFLSLILLKKAFLWAREVQPVQPLTAGVWQGEWTDDSLTALDRFMLNSSDIISFHNYEAPSEMERRIKILQRFERPVICTEFMARGKNSTFENNLPLLHDHNVSAYNWGLVAGKTQTHLPWDAWHNSYTTEPSLWFHDIFRSDGTPYRAEEVDFIVNFTSSRRRASRDVSEELMRKTLL